MKLTIQLTKEIEVKDEEVTEQMLRDNLSYVERELNFHRCLLSSPQYILVGKDQQYLSREIKNSELIEEKKINEKKAKVEECPFCSNPVKWIKKKCYYCSYPQE